MIEDNFLSARAKLAHESQHSNHPRISLQFWHRSSNVTHDLLKLIDCAGESWSLRLFIVARRRMLWALGQSIYNSEPARVIVPSRDPAVSSRSLQSNSKSSARRS